MIKDPKGKHFILHNDNLDLLLDQYTDLDCELVSYKLSHVTDILVVCPPDIDESINRKIKKTNAKYVTVGTLLGMSIDGAIGDDSIIDGAIFGGTLGWIFSTRKNEVTASIILCFKDGYRLALSVSKESLTELLTSVTNAGNIVDDALPSRNLRCLNKVEKLYILGLRRNIIASFIALISSFVFVFFYPFYPSVEVVNTSQLFSQLGTINGFTIYMAVLYLLVLSFVIFFPLRELIKYKQLNNLRGN